MERTTRYYRKICEYREGWKNCTIVIVSPPKVEIMDMEAP